MNVQVIYPLVAVTLLEIIIFVRVSSHGNRWSLCDKVDQLKQGAGLRSMAVNQCITSDQERAAQPMTKCRDPGSMVQVTTESMGSRIKATISACPNVLKVLVYVEAPGYFERGAAANEKTISCFRPHSTLLVQQPMKRVKVTLVSAEQPSDTIFKLKLSWMYQYLTDNNTTKWSTVHEQLACFGDPTSLRQHSAELARERRSHPQSTHVSSAHAEKVCGKDQSCVRFGNDNCSHLQCDYLLTYSIKNLTFLELEISGKATGWLALGLSSDDKMGGDGVIACKRKSVGDKELESVTMWINLAHSRPKVKENMYTLVAQNSTDGYIYCKMTSSLSKKGTDSDTTLDLTNNWYQFYAKGELDRTGLMLKHNELPPISVNTISMLRHVNIYSRLYRQLDSASCSLHRLNLFLSPAVFLALVLLY
ncbi:domon domain-containing protein frrs1l [Biomphalaria glabrata]|nr:hypothetical protein BgiMline_001402 [Biomphalaria glabrata]